MALRTPGACQKRIRCFCGVGVGGGACDDDDDDDDYKVVVVVGSGEESPAVRGARGNRLVKGAD